MSPSYLLNRYDLNLKIHNCCCWLADAIGECTILQHYSVAYIISTGYCNVSLETDRIQNTETFFKIGTKAAIVTEKESCCKT